MSVTGHKSVESLAIYQKVNADEKLMMGLSLTYSLLHPEEVAKIRENQQINQNPTPAIATKSAPNESNTPQLALPAPVIEEKENADDNNLIILYSPKLKNQEENMDFDLMALLADIENDKDDDLVMAATQVEEEISKEVITKSTKSIVKITSPTSPLSMTTFTNCSF